MRQLFIIGNKRSGTSLLTTLLNLHPNVFVTHESDAIWILYQARNGIPSQYECYPWDDPVGMEATLEACQSVLHSYLHGIASKKTFLDAFHIIEKHLMQHGSAIQKPYNKSDLVWIGDQKPVQHGDPAIRPFLWEYFPEAHYIHIVRHPRAVVASKVKAGLIMKQCPPYWRQTPRNILERWTTHEKWALQLKEQKPDRVHTVRLEDLCKAPAGTVAELFDFLEIGMPSGITDRMPEYLMRASNLEQVRSKDIRETFPILRDQDTLMLNILVRPDPNRKYADFQLPFSSRAKQVMQAYGYTWD